MAAEPRTLDDLLSSLSVSVIDSPCTDDHLKKLGLKLSDWRVVAMLLGLEDSEIEDIQEKGKSTAERGIMMLRKWRQSRGAQATYRCMVSAFRDINRIDLVEKICELVVSPTSPASALVQNQSITALQSYTNHLKSLYQAHRPAAIVQTLPLPTDKYFNLALIRKQRVEPPPDDEVVRSIVQEGNIDRVLKTKVGIKLGDIFKADEAARKVILIEGAPGSGKTTLSWHICQKWASGELFQQFSLAVLVQLRDPAIQSALTIADLLPHTDDSFAQEVMSEIQRRGGKGILFVMDGWDEVVLDAKPESVVQQLVFLANPLPISAVIVTCRSESSGQLQEVASSRIETMGFTPSDVKEYFSECLKGDTQAVEKLSEAIQQNPQIEASSYLPLIAAIIVTIFLMTPTSKLPTTLHELFTTLVLVCILHHLQARTEYKAILSLTSLDDLPAEVQLSFDHLCQLAFDGLKKNKLSFSVDELGEYSNLSLLQGVQSFTLCGLSVGVSKTYSFLHLSVQELLAARYISKLSLDEQTKLFHKLIDHPRYTAVFRFFAGITQLKSERIASFFQKISKSDSLIGEYDLLEEDIPLDVLQVLHLPLIAVAVLRQLNSELKFTVYRWPNMAARLLMLERYQCMYLTRPSMEWDHFKLSQLCYVDMRLLLFNCLYEARNPSLYQSLAGNAHHNPPLFHLDDTSMSAFDCLSLGYFLSWVCRTVSSETSICLDISNQLTKFLVKGLTEGIREAKSCRGGIVGSLYIQLDYCAWEHDGLHYLTQLLKSSEGNCISGLELFDSQPTHQDFLCLAEAVETSKSLRALNLHYTSLTKESRLTLGKMLQRNTTLKTLSIATYQTTEVITEIAEELKHNSILETVQFQGFIGSIGLKLLAEIISYNKHLRTLTVINTYRHPSDGTVHLIEALKHNNTLKKITLHGDLTVPQLELLANVLTINTTLETLEYSESVSKVERTALTERLWASGVLHQLLTIALERTVEWFGEQETIKALETILLEWNTYK